MILPALSRFRNANALLLITGLLGTTLACCTSNVARTPAGKGSSPLSKAVLKCDVQIVAVLANGTTVPKVVKVKKGVQIVIWVADADELQIDFVNANPFPKKVECEKRFCGLILPPNGAYGSYQYRGTVKTNGVTHDLDPDVEIVF
jgi:hypothetical protein